MKIVSRGGVWQEIDNDVDGPWRRHRKRKKNRRVMRVERAAGVLAGSRAARVRVAEAREEAAGRRAEIVAEKRRAYERGE